jgi:cell wall-associated NlpC family hydrolase
MSTLRALLPAMLMLAGYIAAANAEPTLPAGARAGDLIFRQGTELVSDAVRVVDRGEFSHVGMLIGAPGQWQVLHATPAERRGRRDAVVIDTLTFYLDPVRAHSHAVYHVQADPPQRQLAIARARAMLGRPFRIAAADGTYCTALVWRAWQQAGVDFNVQFTPLAIPLLQGNYLLPSMLQRSSRLSRLPPAH